MSIFSEKTAAITLTLVLIASFFMYVFQPSVVPRDLQGIVILAIFFPAFGAFLYLHSKKVSSFKESMHVLARKLDFTIGVTDLDVVVPCKDGIEWFEIQENQEWWFDTDTITDSSRGRVGEFFVRIALSDFGRGGKNFIVTVMPIEFQEKYEEYVEKITEFKKLEKTTNKSYDNKIQELVNEWWKGIQNSEVEHVGEKTIMANEKIVQVIMPLTENVEKEFQNGLEIARRHLTKSKK